MPEAGEEEAQGAQVEQGGQEGQEAEVGERLAMLVGKAGMVHKVEADRLLPMVETAAKVRAAVVVGVRLRSPLSGVCKFAER